LEKLNHKAVVLVANKESIYPVGSQEAMNFWGEHPALHEFYQHSFKETGLLGIIQTSFS
jgi:hypothetical protein